MPPLAKRRKTTRFSTNFKTDACIYIIQKEPSTAQLAKKLGVSVSTVGRLIRELRSEKRDIVSVRTRRGWKYQMKQEDPEEVLKHWTSTFVIPIGECHPPRGKAEDDIYDNP